MDFDHRDMKGARPLRVVNKKRSPDTWKEALVLFLQIICVAGCCIYASTAALSWFRRDDVAELTRKPFCATPQDGFDEIIPSGSLQWHPCYDEYLCARLTVPMDYNKAEATGQAVVDIALTMLPGKGHVEGSTRFSVSPLLLNPGGPGNSGTAYALSIAKAVQKLVGDEQDIIGFDPRGVGYTTPPADCWAFPRDFGESGREPTDDEKAIDWFHYQEWMMGEVEIVNSSTVATAKVDQRARLVAEKCRRRDQMYGERSILRHLSTPAVARDMLSIIDAWDAWTGSESRKDTKTPDGYDLDTKGKLVYWGFSYGSFLGSTFAAMFPDRVGRVVLDGVVDADIYVSPLWRESLRDTDKAKAVFWSYCHEAGPACSFYRRDDTPESIKTRYFDTFQKLKDNPIIGLQPDTLAPLVITMDFLKRFMFRSTYFPSRSYPIIADVLDLIDRDEHEKLLAGFPNPYPDFQPYCGQRPPPQINLARNPTYAIMCADKRYSLNETSAEIQHTFEDLSKTSHFADVWTTLMLGCNTWAVKSTDPPMNWTDHPGYRRDPIKTSFPLLYLSNTYDPVTPLFAGVKMARKFVGAGFLEQIGEGHCSLNTASACTLRWVREYFREGKLPRHPRWGKDGGLVDGDWEVCERGGKPWRAFSASEWKEKELKRISTLGEDGAANLCRISQEVEAFETWHTSQESAQRIVAGAIGGDEFEMLWEHLQMRKEA